MCEPKPGCRCAGDTRGAATATIERYEAAHPAGVPVNPLTAATDQYVPTGHIKPARSLPVDGFDAGEAGPVLRRYALEQVPDASEIHVPVIYGEEASIYTPFGGQQANELADDQALVIDSQGASHTLRLPESGMDRALRDEIRKASVDLRQERVLDEGDVAVLSIVDTSPAENYWAAIDGGMSAEQAFMARSDRPSTTFTDDAPF